MIANYTRGIKAILLTEAKERIIKGVAFEGMVNAIDNETEYKAISKTLETVVGIIEAMQGENKQEDS